MEAFELSELVTARRATGDAYLEFVRKSSMSVGLYMLPSGGVDGQSPHTEDEVYYVINGRAYIQVQGESRPVEAGSIIFVQARAEHRFHTITEDLTVLVFFAPAEYTQAATDTSG